MPPRNKQKGIVLDLYNMRENTSCALLIDRILVAYLLTLRVQLPGCEDPCWVRTTGNGENMILYKGKMYSDYSIESVATFRETFPNRSIEPFDYNETQEGYDHAAEKKNTDDGARMHHIGNPVTDYNPFGDPVYAGGTAVPPLANGVATGHPNPHVGTGGGGGPTGPNQVRVATPTATEELWEDDWLNEVDTGDAPE